MKPLWIYGAIPQPAGGVSTFVERLVASDAVPIEGVVDPYYGRKNPISALHIYPSRPDAVARGRALFALARLREHPLLINASQPRAALYLAPLLRRRRAPTFLVLHHGDLRAPSNQTARHLMKKALDRYSRIGCLSQQQQDFYRSVGVPSAKLPLLNNYIPPKPAVVDPANGPLGPVMSWLRRTNGPVIVTSGYAQPYYRHEWLLDEMDSSGELDGARYLICCYGPETPLLKTLRSRADASKSAYLAYGLSAAEFDYVLDNANVYIRPTDIDSFGIAVWDAAGKGLAIVASDACRRPPGAFVHPRGDRKKFLASLLLALSSSSAVPDEIEDEDQRISIQDFLNPERGTAAEASSVPVGGLR